MDPLLRRRVALAHLIVSVAVGMPASWILPSLDPVWFQRVILLISFYAITITAWDVWQSSDIRVEQEEVESSA
jgi:hypothetical protein